MPWAINNCFSVVVNVSEDFFGIDWLWLDFGFSTNHMKKKRIQPTFITLNFHTHWFVYHSWPDLVHNVIWHRDNVYRPAVLSACLKWVWDQQCCQGLETTMREMSRPSPPLLSPSLPSPSPSSPSPSLSPPSLSSPVPSPPFRSRIPLIQLGGLGERCELPQRGVGRIPSRNRIWCISALKYDVWWQDF